MIVTVTANPAYDVTYELPELTPGDVHRVTTVHQRPGGKGVNVAAVLTQLVAEAHGAGVWVEPSWARSAARTASTLLGCGPIPLKPRRTSQRPGWTRSPSPSARATPCARSTSPPTSTW